MGDNFKERKWVFKMMYKIINPLKNVLGVIVPI